MSSFIRRLLVAIFLVSLLFSGKVSSALASTNGQQITVGVCGASRVVVEGLNQYNYKVSYTLYTNSSVCGSYSIPGWWWKTNVIATAYYPNGLWNTGFTNVPVSQPGSDWSYILIPSPNVGQDYVARGRVWVNLGVLYNQNAYRDGYRNDCSGFVSYAWRAGQSYTTVSLGAIANRIPLDALAPGDALNNGKAGNNGHVVLFVRWVNKLSGTFVAYEENGGAGRTIEKLLTLQRWNDVDGNIAEYSSYGPWFAQRRK